MHHSLLMLGTVQLSTAVHLSEQSKFAPAHYFKEWYTLICGRGLFVGWSIQAVLCLVLQPQPYSCAALASDSGAAVLETRLLPLFLAQSTAKARRLHLRMLIQCASKKTAAGGSLLLASGTVICWSHQTLLHGECMVYERSRMACMKVPQWQTSQHHTPVGAKESLGRATDMLFSWP